MHDEGSAQEMLLILRYIDARVGGSTWRECHVQRTM